MSLALWGSNNRDNTSNISCKNNNYIQSVRLITEMRNHKYANKA